MKFGKMPATLSKKNLTANVNTINTNFHDNKTPKEGYHCICLSVILINLVYRKDKNYYPQAFLEECKHVVKKKTSKFITDVIKISSDDCDKKDSDKKVSYEGNSNEENSDEEN